MDQYIFRYKNADPAKLRPVGDRYVIEVLNVDEEVLPSGLILPDRTEEQAGWAVGVVFSVGNGHRLETPDIPITLDADVVEDVDTAKQFIERSKSEKREIVQQLIGQSINFMQPAANTKQSVLRWLSTVPMFFVHGEVIAVERYSGRQFTISNRAFRVVNQVDCLCSFGVYLKWDDTLGWVERDLEAEHAAAEEEQKSAHAAQEAAARIIRPR
jgi:co-chaperonin GroES (HSP10)